MLNINTTAHQNLTNLCVMVIILLIIYSMFYWTTTDALMLKLGGYNQILTVFLLVITSVINVMNYKYQIDDRHRNMVFQYTTITQNEINDIDKMFMNNPLLDRLYFEMYSHTPHIQEIIHIKGFPSVTPEMLKAEHHMASIIFQKIADIYFFEQLDKNHRHNIIEWINTFKNWLKSPILKSHWKYMKYEQHPAVRDFIDQLII